MWPEDTAQSRIFKHKSGCESVERIRGRQQSCHRWISLDCITCLCHTFLPFTSVSTCAFIMVLWWAAVPQLVVKAAVRSVLTAGKVAAEHLLHCVRVCVFRCVCRRATLTYNIATTTAVSTFPAFHVTQSTVVIYIHLSDQRYARAVASVLWPVRASWCRHRVVTILCYCQCWLETICSCSLAHLGRIPQSRVRCFFV